MVKSDICLSFDFDMSAVGVAALYIDGVKVTGASCHKGRFDEDMAVIEKTDLQTKKPSLYKVIMHNDPTTDMDFVTDLLQKFFGHTHQDAALLMWTVHTQGSAVAGVYTKDIAEAKTKTVNDYCRNTDHPNGWMPGHPKKVQFRLTCEKE